MLTHPRFFGWFSLVVVLALAAPPARSQCGPDGLDGGSCCSQLNSATIPTTIPSFGIDCRWLCFNGCNVSLNSLDRVQLSRPFPATTPGGGPFLCGVYNIRFVVRDGVTNTSLWSGILKAFYSRTWQESSVAGAPNLQVWRFIVNGDLLPTAALLPMGPCRRPACLNNFTRCYFSGYIDYAYDCSSGGGWKAAFAVSHECDSIHHATGTARPAPASGLHPTHSFSIVGPGATFVPAVAGPWSDGPISAGAVRQNLWAPACPPEEPATGSFLAGGESCFCTATGPAQYINTFAVSVNGACGSSVSTHGIPAFFFQKRIGSWTNAALFPGIEFVLFDFGPLYYLNGCSMTETQEWFEGGETIGGYPAFDLTGVQLDPEFEDLGSCNNSTTNPAKRVGAMHYANYIMNFNQP